jgi:hypothetical protein
MSDVEGPRPCSALLDPAFGNIDVFGIEFITDIVPFGFHRGHSCGA